MRVLPASKPSADHGALAATAKPRVAVLMPAYNASETIKLSIASLVNNTYPCDIFIIDDGSAVPLELSPDESTRVQLIRLERNVGVARALNTGLKTILSQHYEFVARMDADDICYPDRIAQEVRFLDDHPEIAAVGGWARHLYEAGGAQLFVERTPQSPELIRKALNYNSAIIHSTFMIRTDVLRAVGLYSVDYPVAEDYELFRRITERYKMANIPRFLLDRIISKNGVSVTRRRNQLADRFRIQLRYFRSGELSAWIGIAKTAVLFAVPTSLILKIKEYRFAT